MSAPCRGLATVGGSRPRDPGYHPCVPKPSAAAPARAVRSPSSRAPRYPRNAPAPILAEVRRGSIVESRHRGHVVQVAVNGQVERAAGDPEVLVTLRSAVKPFALVALVESGAADELRLSAPELAVMAASHTGEDRHVRTLQALFRRASVSQTLLACGSLRDAHRQADGGPAGA